MFDFFSMVHPTTGGIVSGTAGGTDEKVDKLLEFCREPKSKNEIQEFLNIKSTRYLREKLINPLVKEGRLFRTIPDKPSSPKQKYYSKR